MISELVRLETAERSGRPAAVEIAPRHLERGARVGRYIVRERIGSGATGAVFAAFDPELDRSVALKLLHSGTPAQRERILNEARALAKLSHPNVVAAYDISEHDGDVVLAMELVAGMDLREWTSVARSAGEILDAYRQVGAGLAAAHRAGLVHRDVKPANILIGDGRARLGDFGLAAGHDGGTELVGTPAYMAPEIFDGDGATASSDQFAFCVALFEALYGARPFEVNFGETVAVGPFAVARSAVVPAYVRAALERGLAADPAKRFPSMESLLAALVPRNRARRRAWIAAALGATGLAAAAFLAAHGSVVPSPCRDAGAEFASVWNEQRAAAVRASFSASGAPFAEWMSRAVATGMAAFGEHWTGARREACEATRVRGTQSDEVLTVRMACLDRALADADALATVLAEGGRDTVSRAATAVAGLPSLADCENTAALLQPVRPASVRDVAAVAEITAALARGRALRDAARWPDAIRVATGAVDAASHVAHDPTRAEALFLLGQAQLGGGAARAAEAAFRDAYVAAERGHDDVLAARAATELVFTIGQQQNRYAEGLEWAFHADALLQRSGGDLDIEARLAANVANIRYGQDDLPKARELYQKALDLDLKARLGGERVADDLYNLGRAATAQGDLATAADLNSRALAGLEATLGPAHPDVASAMIQLGTIQLGQGKFEDGLASFDRALAIAVPALGDRHPDVGRVWISRATALHSLGREAAARDSYARALAIFDVPDGDQSLLAEALAGRGDVEHARGDDRAALATYRRALAIRETVFGKNSEQVASSLEDLAAIAAATGHTSDALAGYRAALAIRDKVDVPDYWEKSISLGGIGDAEIQLGAPAAALTPLRKAVELLAQHDGNRADLANARFSLAVAIWNAGGSRDEARTLVNAAERALADDPQALARVRDWQRSHGGRRP